ncbi:MAG: D-alanyl-D-alanine carboxypeptidase [Sediminicola sp.]
MKNIAIWGLLAVLITGCAGNSMFRKQMDASLSSRGYKNHFTGIMVFDPQTRDTLYHLNGDKYFTPASNTKIFTLYSAMKLLPDSVPILKYIVLNDTLYIEGTGNPATLHPYFEDSTTLPFLRNAPNLSLFPNNFADDPYGPGWAWEDYDSYYSPERNALPLYGNVVTIHMQDSLSVSPPIFRDSIILMDHQRNREQNRNLFYFDIVRKDTLEVPMITDSSLTRKLLSTTLGRKVSIAKKMPTGTRKILWGMKTDSLYKRMMYQSDNFIAEQLLILASSTLSDTLSGATARKHILSAYLSDLQQPPRWVDGSGLSRYNLFTPESMVAVLDHLLKEVPKERLFDLFPTGGETGTLKEWYAGNPRPYVHAKSGSLGNNYCLSGYLVTRSGRTLIFSFMNNHFTSSGTAIKEQVQGILERFREQY